MTSEKNNRGNQGRRPLTREEKIRLERKRRLRNEQIKRERIPLNDSRRSVGENNQGNGLTEEELIQREIRRQRRLYEEQNNIGDDEWSDREGSSRESREPKRRTSSSRERKSSSSSKSRNTQRKPKSSSKPKNNERKVVKPKKVKKKKGTFKNILKAIAGIIIIFIGFSIFSVAGTISKISSNDMLAPRPVPMDKTVNILLLGMDVGDIKNQSDTALKRTDTIMLVNFNPKTKKVNMVSIPRDTLIHINGRRWKINAAYPVGGEKEIVNQVEKLLKIDVNYVANINYTAFRDIIDAIGGVTVEIKHNMDYTDKSQNLRIKFEKGSIEHLDGQKAEEFFRWRKNNDGTGLATGDLGRIQNQHELIHQVVKKCTNPTMIFRLPKILKAIEKNVSTNMPGKTMLGYALKAIGVNPSNVNMVTVKGTPQMIAGQSYVVFNEEANKELIASLQEGAASVGKSNLKVMVVNSTDVSGLAASYRTTLDKYGFKNVEVSSIKDEKPKTYALYRNKEVESIAKKELVGISDYKKLPSDSEYSQYDLVVVLGSDSR